VRHMTRLGTRWRENRHQLEAFFIFSRFAAYSANDAQAFALRALPFDRALRRARARTQVSPTDSRRTLKMLIQVVSVSGIQAGAGLPNDDSSAAPPHWHPSMAL